MSTVIISEALSETSLSDDEVETELVRLRTLDGPVAQVAQVAQVKTTLSKKVVDGRAVAVSRYRSERTIGRNADGKVFQFWQNYSIQTVRLLGSGAPQLLYRTARRSRQSGTYSGLADLTPSEVPTDDPELPQDWRLDSLCSGKHQMLRPHPELVAAAHEHLPGPLPLPDDIYPFWGALGMEAIPSGTSHRILLDFRRRFWMQDTARGLTLSLFGSRRFRKPLVKAVAQADMGTLFFCWQVRDQVPIDWIIDLLRATQDAGMPCLVVRPVTRHLDQRSIRRLMRDWRDHHGTEGFARLVWDACRDETGDRMPLPARADTWNDLHDRMSARQMELLRIIEAQVRANREADLAELAELAEAEQARRDALTPEQRAAEDAEFARQVAEAEARKTAWQRQQEAEDADRRERIPTLVDQLDSTNLVDGYRLVMSHRGDELLSWGHDMSNCIANYIHESENQQAVFGAVLNPEGRVCGNLEVRYVGISQPLTLSQLLGRFNDISCGEPVTDPDRTSMPRHVRASVVEVLVAAGVDVSGEWWGRSLAAT